MKTLRTNDDNYSLWGLIGLKMLGEQPRVNETMCYLELNGNKASVEHYLSHRKGMEDSSILCYCIKDNGNAEIVIKGDRSHLADELRMFGISIDELSLVPPMKTYKVPALSVKDGYSLLDIAGGGTNCVDVGNGEIEIRTDMFPSKIAKALDFREGEIYIAETKGA